jgi:serine/threonine-protein kinase HipA
VDRFFDALAWNWLIGGTDARAKNYSLLITTTGVRMAPLYDIASALPYGAHEQKLRLAMKVGGDYRVYPFHNTWGKAADEMRISKDRALDRVRDLAKCAGDAFADAAAAPDVAGLKRDLPGQLVDLVSDRARRCAMLF